MSPSTFLARNITRSDLGVLPNKRLELAPPRRSRIAFVNGTVRRRSSAASR